MKEKWWALIEDKRSKRSRGRRRKDAAIVCSLLIMCVDKVSLHIR